MKKLLLASMLLGTYISSHAQPKKDVESIKSLCGCYDIEFKYAETFSSDTAYKKSKPYLAHGREWVEAIEETPGRFVFQHLLVINDSTIIKHWREDWTYENTSVLEFEKNGTWKKNILSPSDVKGQWTQAVWEVDDAPRYQGTATWIHIDGKDYWKNTTDAPLPRREYSIRSDYNVMNRTNTIYITKEGWTHEQDNEKVIRKDGQPDKVLASEKGYNIYRKTDNSKCTAAKKWWANNQKTWVSVRKEWDEKIKNSNGEVKL